MNKEIGELLSNNEKQNVIMTSIDELTLVIKPTEDTIGEYPERWNQIAPQLAGTISEKLKLPLLLGDYSSPEKRLPAGYTDGFTFENMPYYFSIAWHERNFTMGVIIKFSASALSHYKQVYKEYFNEFIDVHNIAQWLDEDYWELRLSRIDLAVDYFNYDMTVNDLYQGLKNKQFLIANHKGRKNTSNISAQEVNGIAQTIYVGSKKKNVNALLRIYDKYQEQIDNRGRYVHVINLCNSWIRMEASYKGTYSNQILTLLLTITDSKGLSQLVVNKIMDKYCFYNTEDGTPLSFTSDLLAGLGVFPELESLSSRNNQLMATILYIMKGSSLFPTLKRIEEAWSVEARNHFIIRLIQEYEWNYIPNQDVELWLNKFGSALSQLNYKEYFEDSFKLFYQKNNITPKRPTKNTKE
ncbi:replication initiation factor domain-containing protein [Streptococcus anginosus]|uniref:replication initiation factor domain-containing protein n=1 Tax=Streptococcus anginosus group TaxID=671232 RepID=UPI000D02F794|nr:MULTISPECIES: replication initiation factor domain-containing protein [Streptococcus anginosus group]MCW1036309.1 replication initiation factor domain-containing protein [Streptococcus anginosus]PRT74596.1 replication initiation protein [Streptococcus anginosus]QQC22635.1 replication initiation factor domain-containing protein [Streptococcus constellatus]